MKLYTIYVGAYEKIVRAARAPIAVKRALDQFSDSQIIGVRIQIAKIQKIAYVWRVVADVPSEPAGSYKKQFVSVDLPKEQALAAAADFRAIRPEWRYIRAVRADKI